MLFPDSRANPLAAGSACSQHYHAIDDPLAMAHQFRVTRSFETRGATEGDMVEEFSIE